MDTCTQNFRVGTEWIARENGNHPNFHIIGGDFGNSANKTWGPHGMSRFPGYAVRMGRSAQVLSPRPSTIRGNSINASSSRRHSRTTRCGPTGPSTGTSFPDVSAFV